ncbi:MAG: hypothetical protein LBS55_02230 [Prevotellaceae bacterium]|jgi:hypothetical protein|nr:hypothetical protein [Prevotellaceae bacterium]
MDRGAQIEVDASQVEEMLSALSGNEKKKVSLSVLRKSASILKKETDRRFTTETNLDGKTVNYSIDGRKVSKKISGIAKVAVDKKEYSAKIHIMSDFRAKFFEKGTKIRYTKGRKVTGYHTLRRGGRKYKTRTGKGRTTGSMVGKWIFRAAKQATERRIFDNTEKEMINVIKRIAKRHGRA